MTLAKRIIATLQMLKKRYPAHGALDIGSDFQFLVAVVLSARTRDEQVLKALPKLYTTYPTPAAMAAATLEDIGQCIRSIGFYRAKAKNIQALAQRIVGDFNGEIPRTMEELISLPGVGRKTASVILAARFDDPAIAVDTHVFRITQRLGWAKANNVAHLEKKLLRVVPEKHQFVVNTVMVPFGREICTPGTPRCWACPVVDLCKYKKKNLIVPSNVDQIMQRAQQQKDEIVKLQEEVRNVLGVDMIM